jgi:hypothetical protein
MWRYRGLQASTATVSYGGPIVSRLLTGSSVLIVRLGWDLCPLCCLRRQTLQPSKFPRCRLLLLLIPAPQAHLPFTTCYTLFKSLQCRLLLLPLAPQTPAPHNPTLSHRTKSSSKSTLKILYYTSQTTLYHTPQTLLPPPCYTKTLDLKCHPETAIDFAIFIYLMQAIEPLQLVA